MKESAVWSYLDNHTPERVSLERFEFTHPPGGADCFWTDSRNPYFHTAGWLELKYAEQLACSYKIPTLKPTQTIFLNRMARRNVPSGILLREGDACWRLWVARPSREWHVRMLAGMAQDISWGLHVFDVGEMISTLCRLHFGYYGYWRNKNAQD